MAKTQPTPTRRTVARTTDAATQSAAPTPRRRVITDVKAFQGSEPSNAEKVTVVIPHTFSLTLDDHSIIHYHQGVDEMPLDHFNHWWTKKQGVRSVADAQAN